MDSTSENQSENNQPSDKKLEQTKNKKSSKLSGSNSNNLIGALSIGLSAMALLMSICGFIMFGVLESRIRNLANYRLGEAQGFSGNFSEDGDGATVEQVVGKVAPSVVSIEIRSGRSRSSSGSGIIVSSDGYILTNRHVVEGGGGYTVYLDDGRSFSDVKLAASDSMNDIAFLKIQDASDLPAAELGDSKYLRLGQPVIAIGNALGEFQNTVTSGIISGMGRSIVAGDGFNSESLTDMIQTDASINPGNSGGPLVNAHGQVIGVNTAVSTSAQGIGFAIPIGATKGMLESLKHTGSAERAYIGVQYLVITPELAEEYDLPVQQGAYVYSEEGTAVISGGPADKAGLKNGDIDDDKIGEKGSLSSLIAEHSVGEEVLLKVIRNGEETTILVALGNNKG